jgi:hypothetical protein
MAITLNGTTGITTPADTVTGNASVGGTLNVTGATTLGAATLGATTATSLSVAGTAAVAVAPGTNGNVLTSNGTVWTSAAPAAGGVTSIVAGTGITTSGTTTVTVNVATTAGAVGTYALLGSSGANFTAGSTYAGSGLNYAGLPTYSVNGQTGGCQNFTYTAAQVSYGSAVSGTWRAMGTVVGSTNASANLFLRIA